VKRKGHLGKTNRLSCVPPNATRHAHSIPEHRAGLLLWNRLPALCFVQFSGVYARQLSLSFLSRLLCVSSRSLPSCSWTLMRFHTMHRCLTWKILSRGHQWRHRYGPIYTLVVNHRPPLPPRLSFVINHIEVGHRHNTVLTCVCMSGRPPSFCFLSSFFFFVFFFFPPVLSFAHAEKTPSVPVPLSYSHQPFIFPEGLPYVDG
jgi:hypothetical protein